MKQLAIKSAALVCTLSIILLAGCDSGDPIDGSNGNVEPVYGSYEIEAFAVIPEASVIPPLNMLDTLVHSDTRLQLFDGGDFILTYRYEGGSIAALFGSYSHTAREVRLQAAPTSSDLQNLRALLMTERLTMQRQQESPRVLSASFRRTVDMSELSDSYEGLPALTATVVFRVREEVGVDVPELRR